ncbi:MAG TPA: hypothetical protein VGJ60_11295 [Chloroflexota bacterium]|jgi:hypothetical protein
MTQLPLDGLSGPLLDERQAKALLIVANGGVLDARIVGASRVRLVVCQTCDGAFHLATADDCSCNDNTYRGAEGVVCKHRLAVRIRAALDAPSIEPLPF